MVGRLAYLAVGNPSIDLVGDQRRFGGSSVYAAVQASRYGLAAGIAGVVGDTDATALTALLTADGVNIQRLVTSSLTTSFQNRYNAYGDREQTVLEPGESIPAEALIDMDAAVVHIAPIVSELVLKDVLRKTPSGAFVGLTPQGLMRRTKPDGTVTLTEFSLDPRLACQIGAVVVGAVEAPHCARLLRDVARAGGVSVVTHGADGATLLTGDRKMEIPSAPAVIRDATGAGDVFAAILFCELSAGCSLAVSAARAAAAAALCVGSVGIDQLPSRDQVLAASNR
jgi:sugar/nucleoside kinase (ribokinase family)